VELRPKPDGVREVAGHELDAAGQARSVRVAGERAHRLMRGDELLDDLPADRAGGSLDEDHLPASGLTSRSDLPTTSRAPRAVASWTSSSPIPPAAPVISTGVPAFSGTPSRMPSAVRPSVPSRDAASGHVWRLNRKPRATLAAAQGGVEPEQRDGRHIDHHLAGAGNRIG
jgi:hypothetical protein